MKSKEQYAANCAAGQRGQGHIALGQVVRYTPAAQVIQGVYGTRKARRAVEAHGTVRKHRAALRGESMKAVVYRKYLLWRVKIVARNGEIVMNSETYYSRSNAVRAARRLKEELGLLEGAQ